MGLIQWLRNQFNKAEEQEQQTFNDGKKRYEFEGKLYTSEEWFAKVKHDTPLSLASLTNVPYRLKRDLVLHCYDVKGHEIMERNVKMFEDIKLRLLQCAEHPEGMNAFRYMRDCTVFIHFDDMEIVKK